MTNRNGTTSFFDRAYLWVVKHVFNRNVSVLQTKTETPIRVGRPHKPIKSYGTSSYRFYRIRADQIGFTGSKKMYKIVKEAIEKSGLRYELRYFGTRITKG